MRGHLRERRIRDRGDVGGETQIIVMIARRIGSSAELMATDPPRENPITPIRLGSIAGWVASRRSADSAPAVSSRRRKRD